MGCAVNGPGEAGDADFGIAGGRDVGFIYAHGRVLKKVCVRDARRRALPRDRRVDRGGDAPAEAPEDGEARGARDGRGFRDSARLVLREDGAARLPALLSDPARRPGRRRGGQPQAARPRRVHPPGERRPLDVPAPRLAGSREGRPDHPRGDGRDRRAGDADARADARGALAGDRALRDSGGLQAPRPQRPRVRPADDARGDGHLPRAARSSRTATCRRCSTTSRRRTATSRGRAPA